GFWAVCQGWWEPLQQVHPSVPAPMLPPWQSRSSPFRVCDEHTAHQNAPYSLPCPVDLWGVVCSYDLVGSWLNSYPWHGLLPDSPFCLISFSVQVKLAESTILGIMRIILAHQ